MRNGLIQQLRKKHRVQLQLVGWQTGLIDSSQMSVKQMGSFGLDSEHYPENHAARILADLLTSFQDAMSRLSEDKQPSVVTPR